MKKSVTFNEENNKVYLLVVWSYAQRQSRKSEFTKQYLDRLRFERKIKECEDSLRIIFDEKHRNKIFNQRYNVN